jgi:hypothetical protein
LRRKFHLVPGEGQTGEKRRWGKWLEEIEQGQEARGLEKVEA